MCAVSSNFLDPGNKRLLQLDVLIVTWCAPVCIKCDDFYFYLSNLATFRTSFSGCCLSTWNNVSFAHNLALSFFYLRLL